MKLYACKLISYIVNFTIKISSTTDKFHLPAMHVYGCSLLIIYISIAMGSFEFHRTGWLDKMVEYHKNKLFEDFHKVPEVQIVATIHPAPEGYVDSPKWDVDSVDHLLYLILQSKSAVTVKTTLRRMLQQTGNTRRMMTFQETVKAFPSLAKLHRNDIYYDFYSGEMYGDVVTEETFLDEKDNGIIMVSNPVEARLPSAMISINLLRKILEERAKAARYMPTTRRTFPWKPMTKTSTTPAQSSSKPEGATSTDKPDGNTATTGGTDASGTGTTGGAAETTAPA